VFLSSHSPRIPTPGGQRHSHPGRTISKVMIIYSLTWVNIHIHKYKFCPRRRKQSEKTDTHNRIIRSRTCRIVLYTSRISNVTSPFCPLAWQLLRSLRGITDTSPHMRLLIPRVLQLFATGGNSIVAHPRQKYYIADWTTEALVKKANSEGPSTALN